MDAIVIGGFLGSGKTTTVINFGKFLLRKGIRLQSIVNEIGEIGIDGDLISKYGLDTKEITNGCICCTLKVSMKTTLIELRESYNPDFVIIEPSGIAFPNMIKKEIELMNLGVNVKVSPLTTLIDGSRFKAIMKSVKTYAIRQIEDADILVLNKVDLVESLQLPVLEASVQQLNPKAKVLKMSSKPEDPGFNELLKMILPEPAMMEKTNPIDAHKHETETHEHEHDHQEHEEHIHHEHTHYDSDSSGLASYANDYKILAESIDSDMAKVLAMDIAESVKYEIIKFSPEFVGHVKMFLESPHETIKISITAYSETPQVNVIKTTSDMAPRFKILTAVSGMEEDSLVHLVDESVKSAFEKKKIKSLRLHEPHDHDHHHDHDHDHHDHDHHDHRHHEHQSHEEISKVEDYDDIYDHDLKNNEIACECHTDKESCKV
jgi:G3E family GTPase